MSTHNIGFYEDLTKIIFELSSNAHLISSAGYSSLKCPNFSAKDCNLRFNTALTYHILFFLTFND